MDNSANNIKHGQTIDRAFLFSLLQQKNCVLLESSRQDSNNNKNLLFHSPIEVLIAKNLDEIPEVFRKIEHHIQNKKWIGGYVGYECGYHFENVTSSFKNDTSSPLLWLGVYEKPIQIEQDILETITHDLKSKIQKPKLAIDENTYQKKIEKLKKYIVNGDTYQVNFTDRFEFDFDDDAIDLYFTLRKKQHVPFGAFLNTEGSQILSFSPELFFRQHCNRITTKPMKGTCKRGRNLDEDNKFSEWLSNDEKNRSENLMITDLLRNDIGKICEIGSVAVSDLYSIEKYETVLQMTSTVSGTLKKNIEYYQIFKALFPCGSVTGAPKIRTMQIINEIEQHPRGVYCGAIGYISPENESVFNVAIRTIELNDNKGVMGVGSGIVFDSEAKDEFEECNLKAAFLLEDQPDFQLLETILWKNGFTFLEQHLERMKNSADYFFISFNREKIIDSLMLSSRSFDSRKEYRIRLLLSKNGTPFVEAKEILQNKATNIIKIATDRTNAKDKFLFHKTTHRPLYNRYLEKAQRDNISDYIFLNGNDEITEGAITNVFVEKHGKLFTPPISCGLLSGIYRDEVLRTNSVASEKLLNIDDLHTADALYICNSVRGWIKVTLSD